MKNIFCVFFSLLSLNSFAGNGKNLPMASAHSGASFIKAQPTAEYEASKVILRVKGEYRNFCTDAGVKEEGLLKCASILGGNFEKIFPGKVFDEKMKTRSGLKPVDLSLLYAIHYNNNISVEKAIEIIFKTGVVDFAEPSFVMHEMYIPNDTINWNQAYLSTIKAFQAYDLAQGDSSIVIGITDSGVNTAHLDLTDNIAYNYLDPINGLDDDHDGYIDNFKGWDLGADSNNPLDTMHHGTGVAGIAAASSNNITGITGTGFKCRFLPIKVSRGNTFNKSYEGIVYAADHACQVINCSWGGTGGGNYGQTIIDYAAINCDAVVVASAGNSNKDEKYYPAAYDHVLSVSGVNNDIKTPGSGGSTFNYSVDIASPSSNLYTTRYDGTYIGFNGTSAAAPVISGCAGIVRFNFPNYNALQVAEQLRMTADVIDTLPSNLSYKEKLGKGRANLFNAVSNTAESVRLSQLFYADNNDQILIQGDTIDISALFTNYLMPANALSVSISSPSSHVKLIDSVISIGAMNTMASFNNSSMPFRIQLTSGLSVNEKITIKFSFNDGVYNDFQYAEITVNSDYINISVNDISTTISSKACFGYSVFPQLEGLGFDYKGNNLLFAGSLMVGNSSTSVSDNVYGSNVNVADNDFLSVSAVKRLIPSVVSDFDIAGEFNDSGAAAKLGISVKQNAYAWSSPGNRKFVILKYKITNNNLNTLPNLYAGIFADWDIMNYASNRCSLNLAKNLAYAFSTEKGGLYAGIRLLTSGTLTGYMNDNDGSSAGIILYDGFSPAEKFKMLSSNRANAGMIGQGSDISMTLNSGPYFLVSGDSATVAFALLAGDSVKDIESAAQAAQIKYDMDIATSTSKIQINSKIDFFPNPANDKLFINNSENLFAGKVNIEIFDLIGRKVFSVQENTPKVGSILVPTQQLSPGIYLLKMYTSGQIITGKFVVDR